MTMTSIARDRPLDLVYFSGVDWGYTWQRPQQLASRLSRHGKVLYVDPLGLRSLRLSDLPRIVGRAAERLGLPRERRPERGLTLSAAPLAYLPFPTSAAATRINGRLLRRAVARWMRRSDVGAPVIWVGTPSAAVLEAITGLPARLLVYDCLDRFTLFHEDGEAIARTEQAIVSRVDVVLTASRELYESMGRLNPRTFLVPNAADYAHFSKAASPREPPAALAGLSRPILGYFGEIAHWFDVQAVRSLAASRPGWSLVLIGPLHTAAAGSLLDLPNVHYLGRRPYHELPRYLAHFDVCLLPFRVSELTSATNPVKLYEYLASGRPVVSTPLPEVLPYRDVVRIAEPSALVEAVEASLQASGDREAAGRRMAVAHANTWDHRVEQILGILETAGGGAGSVGSAGQREPPPRSLS